MFFSLVNIRMENFILATHKDMKRALDALKTLSHPVRLSIICNLMEKGEMSAGEIFAQEEKLASASQTSQYLRKLKDCGILQDRKDGQFVYYRIKSAEIEKTVSALKSIFRPKKH